jgi:hypothetical protein
MVVVFPPLVAVSTLAAVPCKVKACPLAPTVRAPLGVMVLRAVVLVMSPFAPEAAAPRLLRAVAALLALVPPLAIGNKPVKVMFPAESSAMLPEAETATVPEAFGKVIVLLEPAGVAKTKLFVKPLSVAVSVVLPLPCSVRL